MTVKRAITTALATVVLTAGLGFATTATAAAAPADCAYLGYGSAPDTLALKHDATEQRLATMINQYRASKGLPQLAVSTSLARPTMWVTLDSARRGYSPADHIDTRGMGAGPRAYYCSGYADSISELSYWGQGGGYAPTAEAAFASWKQSSEYNAVMLRDFTHFSVARAYVGENAERQHWTVSFGRS